jgi:hypothetical protein
MSEKQKQAWSVFFEVFCGVFCGWVVGQYLTQQLSSGWGGLVAWTACVVTGGLLGYVLVDPWSFFAKLPNAVRVAWRECVKSASSWPRCACFWKYRGTVALVLLSNVAWFACAFFAKKEGILLPEDRLLPTFLSAAWLSHSIFACMIFLAISDPKVRTASSFTDELIRAPRMRDARVTLFQYGNPVCFVLIVLPLLVCLLIQEIWRYAIRLFAGLPSLLRFVCFVGWHLYKLTHTKARLIAMADAALFAGAAFFTHSITLGLLILLIGAIWGVVNCLFIAPILA